MIYNQLQKGPLGTPVSRFAAGLVLLWLATMVLWLNEGAMDVAKITRSSIALSADKVENTANRKLVSVTGKLMTDDEIGDPQFLKPGRYLKLMRKVQMFAWQKQKTGKGFEKVWTPDPKPINGNPSLTLKNKTWQASSVQVGAYTIDPQMVELPSPEALKLSADKMVLRRGDRLDGKFYVFSGDGTPKKPHIGDLRISYLAVENSVEVTAFGKKEGDMLAPSVTVEYKFYKIFRGDRDEAFAQLPAQHTGRLWLFRLVGLLLMWLGFSLFSLPAERLNRRWPQFSQPALTLLLAAAVSLLVVLLSIYSISLLLIFALALAGYFVYIYQKGRQ